MKPRPTSATSPRAAQRAGAKRTADGRIASGLANFAALCLAAPAQAGPVQQRVQATATVRVCVRLQCVDSSFVTPTDDLQAERCGVAMFAGGMLPQRREQLKFTRPCLQSGIYGVTTKGMRAVRSWAGRLDGAARRHGLGEIVVR